MSFSDGMIICISIVAVVVTAIVSASRPEPTDQRMRRDADGDRRRST
jgi:hypothetical protein